MKKMKKGRGVSILLLFMLVFQLMMPVNFAYGDTYDGEQNIENNEDFAETTSGTAIQLFGVGPQKDLGSDIFDFDYMEVDGERVKDNDIITIEKDTSVKIRFTWNTESLDPPAKGEDTASIKLADVFDTVGPFPIGEIIVKDISNPDDKGTNVGNYSIDNGELKFEFNSKIENSTVKNGFVEMEFQFNLEKFKENIKQQIPFQEEKIQNLTVISRPSSKLSGIKKDGKTDTKENATEINWGINVINTSENKITGAEVDDTLPNGLGDPRDFKVYELKIGMDGEVEKGAEVLMTKIPTSTGFSIALGDMEALSGYRIEFITDIDYNTAPNQNGVYSFTNEATFDYDENEEEPLPAEVTVGGLTRSDSIEKDGWFIEDGEDGYVNGKDRIRWTIDVNKNGQSITDAIVKDTLPTGLVIDTTTIKVVKITQGGNDWVEGAAHTNPSINTTTGFLIGLGELEPGEAYRIIFDTEVNWETVGDNYKVTNSFTNTAELLDGTKPLDDDDKEVTFNRKSILEKVGVSNVNYDDKTITWTVTVNEAKHPFGTLTVTDYLPIGLELETPLEDNIKVVSDEGDGSYSSSDYTFTASQATTNPDGANHDGKTKLLITLNSVGTKTLTIIYTTKVTNFTIGRFTNWIGMGGTGVGEGGGGRDAHVNPDANSYAKVVDGIDYVGKTMGWKLTVDTKREALKSLTIEDTFLNKGLILLPSTVEVELKKPDNTTEILTLNTHYTLQPRTENGTKGYQKGFIINIVTGSAITPINGVLTVKYKTSYDPKYVDTSDNTLDPHEENVKKGTPPTADGLYVNRAIFTGQTVNDNPINEIRDADRRVVSSSWNSGEKQGQLISVDNEGNTVKTNDWISGAERRIAWQLYINYQEHNIGKVKVEDTLQYVGDIHKDSIEIYQYTVNPTTGKMTKTPGTKLTENDDYTVVVTNKEDNTTGSKFEVTFLKDVTKRYIIEFTTSVEKISKQNYTNRAEVSGGNLGDTKYPYSATVSYSKYNNFLDKQALVADKTKPVYTGDEVNWKVTVNDSVSIVHDAVITDTISDGHVYKDKSLVIYKLQDLDKSGNLIAGKSALTENTDYKLEVVSGENGTTVLRVTLLKDMNPLEDTLVLNYITVVTTVKGNIDNKVTLAGQSITTVTKETDSLSAKLFSSAGGEWASDKGALIVTKTDVEDKTITTDEATFELWYELNGKRVQYVQVDANDVIIPFKTVNGVIKIGNLPFKTYYLKEIAAPNGYVLSEGELEIVVDNPYNNNEANATLANFKNVEKTEVKATKIWSGGPVVKPTIQLQLYRDGSEKVGEAVELPNGTTTHIWTDLPKTDETGKLYKYTVEEVEIPDNYGKSIDQDTYTITNTYGSPVSDVVGRKVWDGGEKTRPEFIELQLYRQIEGSEVETVGSPVKLNKGENEYTWKDMPINNDDGIKYSYFVKEVNVPDNYAEVYSKDGLTVTNTYTSPTTTVSAIKVWNGGSEPRPTIWFELYRQIEGGNPVKVDDERQKLENGINEVTWLNLPKTDEQGNEYIYSVKEVDENGNDFVPSGYTKSESGLTVTNTRRTSGGKDPDPVFGKIVVKKVDEDKKVLEGAEFILYDSNGKVVARATTGKDGVVSFEKLEKGSYVLKETKAPVGYVLDIEETDVEIKGSETKTFTFTNKKEEPKKPGRVEIIKTDEDGKLLSDARFALVNSDGETVKTVTTVNGHAAFENVPVGRYKIKEVQAPVGFELSTNTISVSVESEQTVTVRVENRLIDRPTTPVDPDKPGVPKTGSISIFKVDENTKPLAGAEFTLYNDNTQIIGTAVSGSDGKVVFSNLKEGIYHVVETNAPDGYALVDEILIVNVDEAKTYSYRFRNVPEDLLIEDPDIPLGWETIDDPDVPTGTIDPTNPDGKLPNTGSIFNTWLLAAVGFVLIFAGLFIKKRRVLN